MESLDRTDAAVTALPRSRRKIDQILTAAGSLFRERGYGATTMEAVAHGADVSKATLYVYFSGKHELFSAVVSMEGDRNSRPLIAGEAGEDIRTQLLRFGRTIVDLLLAPETVATYRMVAAESARFPDLGRAYYENGAARLLNRLEDFFADAMAADKLRKAHPRRAAEQFIGLIRGDMQLRALLGVRSETEPHQDTVIRSGVDTFCRAYGTGQETATL